MSGLDFKRWSAGDDKLRAAAVARSKKATDALRERHPVDPAVVEAFPTMGGAIQAGREPQQDEGGNFLQRRLGAAEQRAAAPPQAEGEVFEEVPAQPEADPFGDVSMGAMGYGGALQNAQMMDASYKNVSQANPLHGATADRIGTGREVNDNREKLAKDAYAAEMGRAAATADGMDLIAETQLDIADRNLERERMQAERNVRIEETLNRYESQIAQAVQGVQDAQKVDPSAGWANKSAGQKVRMVLAAMFRGARGMDPMAYISRAVADEVDAQKANQGQALAAARTAMDGYKTAAGGIRDTMLAMNADERAADKATEIALYESTLARMQAAQAEYDAQGTNAQAAQAMNELTDTIAAKKLELAQMEAANPRYFTRRVSTMGANERRVRRSMGDQMVKTAGEAQKQGLAAQASQQKDVAQVDTTGLTREQRQRVSQHTENPQNKALYSLRRQLTEILAQEDIPGVKWAGEDLFGSDAGDFEQQNLTMSEDIFKAFSGAGGSDQEAQRHIDMLTGHVNDKVRDPISLFAAMPGEERYRKNLQTILNRVDTKIETARRGLDQGERDFIDRQHNADYIGEGSGNRGYGRKRVQAADGSITTDRSEFE